MEGMVAKADCVVKGKLPRVLEEYWDIFPKKLLYGPPPRRMIDNEIKVAARSEPRQESPYKLNNVEMEKLQRRVETLLEQG